MLITPECILQSLSVLSFSLTLTSALHRPLQMHTQHHMRYQLSLM